LWVAKAKLGPPCDRKAAYIDDLRQSILQKAFAGELT